MTDQSVFAQKPYPTWLLLLGVLTTVTPLAIDMYLPSFPAIANELGAAPGSLEISLSSFCIGMTLGQLFYGPFSDRFGRKPPLYFGIILFTVASVAAALANSALQLIAFRFIEGFGGCAGFMIPNAIVRDRASFKDSARAFSLLMLVLGVAPILAPWLGGQVLIYLGWRAIFWFLAFFGLVCLTLTFFCIDESHDTKNEQPLRFGHVIKTYCALMVDRSFIGYASAGGMSRAGMMGYIAGSPFVLMSIYHIKPEDFGFYFGLNAIGLIAASQINAKLLRYFHVTAILRTALWVPALAGVGLLLLNLTGVATLAGFALCFFLFVMTLGFIAPNATACALAAHGQRAGTAAALASALQFFFGTLAGAGVGLLQDGTGFPLALIMSIAGFGGFIVHRLVVTHKEN